ncbi:MAG: M67 family metallopeptidase [Nitrospirota bacterium]
MQSDTQLVVPSHLVADIIAHCKEVYPNEACGILAGKNRVVQKVYKMTNIENSGVSYMMEPREQFTIMKELREQGLEMSAIYHSHPYSDAYPSPKDIRLAFYPDSVYVIVSLIYKEPLIKAFEIKDGIVREVEIISILK